MKELNKPLHLGCYVRFIYLSGEQIGRVIEINDKTVKVKTMLIGSKYIEMKLNISAIISVK